jgi:hypothetical protein
LKELKKRVEEEILNLPEGIVKTDIGDLKAHKIGTKFVHVYNLNKQRSEQYTLKDFAFFALDWKVDILEEAVREYVNFLLQSMV